MNRSETFQILAISGSLRANSFSTAILNTLRKKSLPLLDITVKTLEDIPPYNEDLDVDPAIPAVAALRNAVLAKIKTFTTTEEVLPGVMVELHPGHTPGSAFYTLRSHGQEIVFIGDIIHVASVQAPDPEITITYEENPAMAAAVRQQVLSTFADRRTLVAVPHLPFPGVGHFRRVGAGFEWVPVAYGNREPGSEGAFADPHKNGDKH